MAEEFVPFQPEWVQNVEVYSPDGELRFDLNPTQIASYGTALAVARLLGGTVVEAPWTWWQTSYPILHVQVPTGAILNAGLVADLFRKHGTHATSEAWNVIRRDWVGTEPQFTDPSGRVRPVTAPPGAPLIPSAAAPAPATPSVRPPGVTIPAPRPLTTTPGPTLVPSPTLAPPTLEYRPQFIGVGGTVIGGSLGPPGWIAVAIGTILTGLFAIFGGGGVNKATQRALEGLRDSQVRMGDALMRFSWGGFFGFGWLLRAVQTFWVRIIRPLMGKVFRIIDYFQRLIDRVLKPYLQLLAKIREHVLRIYETYVRPVLDAIQKVRQVLAVFRIAGFKWAIALDDALGKVQGKIAQAVSLVFRQLGELSRWMNVLLTWRLILQQPIWVNSSHAYAQLSALQFWNAHLGKPARVGRAGEPSVSRPVSVAEASAGLALFARRGVAPYADEIRAAAARVNLGGLP